MKIWLEPVTIEIGPTQASVPSVTTLIFFTIHEIKESDSNDLIKIMVQADILCAVPFPRVIGPLIISERLS